MNTQAEGLIAILLCFIVIALVCIVHEIRNNNRQQEKNRETMEELLKKNDHDDLQQRVKRLEQITQSIHQ